ncbi:sensor histidine kinase [Actinoplanes sp. CA-142083]|uniref:sensor histidine kinase n=1 Tax=Actinoplanes sp. CA-142083 TaxID=3239903 RepID=UPI003D8C4E33
MTIVSSPGVDADVTRTRLISLGFLATLLLARCADAAVHQTYAYLPFVAALFVLPVWYVSGVAAHAWTRWRWWLLAGQALLTYVPFVLFGDGWVAGMSGLLGGLVLLLVPAPRSWLLLGALLALEATLWVQVVGVPYRPAINAGVWVLVAFADVALGLFGLSRLSQSVRDLGAAQEELAAAAVDRERLATQEQLRRLIGDRIQQVAQHARAALRWLSTTPEDARGEIAAAGVIARQAAAESRRLHANDPINSDLSYESSRPMTAPRTARAVLVTVVALFATQNLLNVTMPSGEPPAPRQHLATAVLVAVVVSLGILALQWYHAGAGSGRGKPRHWPYTLALLAVMTYAQVPVVGYFGMIFVAFLAASGLLLLPGVWRWWWFGAAVVSVPALYAHYASGEVFRAVYTGAISASFGLMAYGLSRLAGLAVQLAHRREDLAAVAAVRERLRLARDTHDLLGLGLSTVALKSDLIAALIGRDDARAARELGELLHVCATVRSDTARIAGERPQLSLDTELALATDLLTSSEIHVNVTGAGHAVPAAVDNVLAIVLREATTNILRHSQARQCAITVESGDGLVRLRVSNDGAAPVPGTGTGQGLDNLRTRVAGGGGVLTSRHTGGTFVMMVELPFVMTVELPGARGGTPWSV